MHCNCLAGAKLSLRLIGFTEPPAAKLTPVSGAWVAHMYDHIMPLMQQQLVHSQPCIAVTPAAGSLGVYMQLYKRKQHPICRSKWCTPASSSAPAAVGKAAWASQTPRWHCVAGAAVGECTNVVLSTPPAPRPPDSGNSGRPCHLLQAASLRVRGMHCASCSSAVEKALKGTQGVQQATVSLAMSQADVQYDPLMVQEVIDGTELLWSRMPVPPAATNNAQLLAHLLPLPPAACCVSVKCCCGLATIACDQGGLNAVLAHHTTDAYMQW